ncbi:hypothetical protein AMTR_s00017p00216660 [Amborella trichopoda]|uniref:Peptidase S8/S53 domain-containing protein n=1 Tax=Amborella trichopoda TaxID=13333 RepID=W1PNE5_AMBTC|nr:hypothetical protein AMTR_s00017p00216660 [Amborella trichopoda]
MSFSTNEEWHKSMLASLSAEAGHLYTYSLVVHGFSARLSRAHLARLEELPGHRATHRDAYAKLFTTRTPRFLGLRNKNAICPAASFGRDVIVGSLTLGFGPTAGASLIMGCPWCQRGGRGRVRMVPDSPHHSATGNSSVHSPSARIYEPLADQSLSMIPTLQGISMAMAYIHPRQLQAVLSACHVQGVWFTDSDESAATDVLADMDQAIADGVDVMSLSLGFDQTPYYDDVIAIGAFAALEKRIFVACAAGNDGPSPNSINNGAPWIMTVGAGTIDQSFAGSVTLGNGVTIEGDSYSSEDASVSGAPLYYGVGNATEMACSALDPAKV